MRRRCDHEPILAAYREDNDYLLAENARMHDALSAIHQMTSGAFASGGTFGDIVSIEGIARNGLGAPRSARSPIRSTSPEEGTDG